MRFLILTCVIALVSGCANPSGNYCDIHKPLLFGSGETVEWLGQNDQDLLRGIVTENEKWEAICNG
jgi:hypothetical protein